MLIFSAGSPPLSGSGTVTILVSDVNDNAPQFSSLSFHTSVAEDAPTGSDVLLVAASDADTGLYAAIRWGHVRGRFPWVLGLPVCPSPPPPAGVSQGLGISKRSNEDVNWQ